VFDHVKFGVSDYAASKAFFLEALEPLGVAVVAEGIPTYGVELSPEGKASLCLYQTDGKPAPLHLAFTAEKRAQVDAFHRAALAAGGKDNGAPGLRPHLPRELLRGLRHRPGRTQHRGGVPRARRAGERRNPRIGADRRMPVRRNPIRDRRPGPQRALLSLHDVPQGHGTAFRARLSVPIASFRFVQGEDLLTSYRSSGDTIRRFCRICGSSIVNSWDPEPDCYGLAMGSLDDDPGVRPLRHEFVGSKAPWYEITDGLPQYREFPET
jgi:hypothetical protein